MTEAAPAIAHAQAAMAAQVARDCPGELRGAPSGQLSKEFAKEIVGAQSLVARQVTKAASEVFSKEVARLEWSDPRIAPLLRSLVEARRQILRVPLPELCDDARAWAASNFQKLGKRTLQFNAALGPTLTLKAAEGRGTVEATINDLLARYETAGQRVEAKRQQQPPTGPLARTPGWVEIIDALGMSAH